MKQVALSGLIFVALLLVLGAGVASLYFLVPLVLVGLIMVIIYIPEIAVVITIGWLLMVAWSVARELS